MSEEFGHPCYNSSIHLNESRTVDVGENELVQGEKATCLVYEWKKTALLFKERP
jgi:hypothetical protein